MPLHPLLGPLPTSDANSALQRESLSALVAALPSDRIIFRPEQSDDLGVDASLEVIDANSGTNHRAQVQLKSRSGLAPDNSGVIYLSIPTSNINYLLNGTCPLYILYRPETKELRYAFARDEIHRIAHEVRDWHLQKSITVHFSDLLTPASLDTIISRIADESRLNRLVHQKISPLSDIVWGLDKISDWLKAALSRKLSSSKLNEIQTPPAHVAGPVLLNLTFCADQAHLRELYASLLASAMIRSYASNVHPAFAQIIQQMSPDEALIMRSIAAMSARSEIFSIYEEYDVSIGEYEGETVSGQFSEFCKEAEVAHESLSDAYLDNLLRLRLLSENIFRFP